MPYYYTIITWSHTKNSLYYEYQGYRIHSGAHYPLVLPGIQRSLCKPLSHKVVQITFVNIKFRCYSLRILQYFCKVLVSNSVRCLSIKLSSSFIYLTSIERKLNTIRLLHKKYTSSWQIRIAFFVPLLEDTTIIL